MQRRKLILFLWLFAIPVLGGSALAQALSQGPAPPSNVQAKDHPFDGGEAIVLSWQPPPGDSGAIVGYDVYRSLSESEIVNVDADRLTKSIRAAKTEATDAVRASAAGAGLSENEILARIRSARREAEERAAAAARAELAARADEPMFKLVTSTDPGIERLTVSGLNRDTEYVFRVESVSPSGLRSSPVVSSPIAPSLQWFDGSRFFLLIVTTIFCGSVVFWIKRAASGRELKVRKIAGLEAVDEAVGRATEMGRSVMYIPGIQDMNDIQTIASMTVLSRVSKTAAGYDVKVEVPTARSLVMTTAREIVRAAFMAAGRPDSYNQDLIYYVTDEQFGFVAYLSGLMVREKPAACFYMGAFFAESLILAETGNSIGAIQVAGTAMPAQLPFFVAACDYTLIGEEFFAASAYLSGSPEELGSLKGQDVGKVVVGIMLVVGVAMATLASLTGSEALADAVQYLKQVVLT